MMERYPSDIELEKIENWDGTPRELIEFIDSIWAYNQDDWKIRNGRDILRKKTFKISFSTWGWSGNEDIVEALQGTMFWWMFWWSSRRGGHYELEVSPTMIDKKFPGGTGWGKIRKKEEKHGAAK